MGGNYRWNRRTALAGAGAALADAISSRASEFSRAHPKLAIDHISLGVRDLFGGSAKLQRETGIQGIEGSWFPEGGMANRYFRTGHDTYIEVEAITDPFAAEIYPTARHLLDRLRGGDCFLGWVIRVRSREELAEIAARLKSEIIDAPLGFRADGGSKRNYVRTPETFSAWSRGLPNFTYWDGSPKPLTPGPVKPSGIAWLEIGGHESEVKAWIGPGVEELPLRFNGKEPGLHAVGISSDRGEIVVRRRPLPL